MTVCVRTHSALTINLGVLSPIEREHACKKTTTTQLLDVVGTFVLAEADASLQFANIFYPGAELGVSRFLIHRPTFLIVHERL